MKTHLYVLGYQCAEYSKQCTARVHEFKEVKSVFVEKIPGALLEGSVTVLLALVLIPVAIACGWLSYRLIERPAMRLAAGSR